jgi:hypothetical protein
MKLWFKMSERVYVLEVQLEKYQASRLFSMLGAAFEYANTQNAIQCSFLARLAVQCIPGTLSFISRATNNGGGSAVE